MAVTDTQGVPARFGAVAGYYDASIPPELTIMPTVTAIAPNTAVVGGSAVSLHVTGTDFSEYSVIVFNGGVERTTYVSPTEVRTIVEPATATGAFTVPVQVRNGVQTSNAVDFSFTVAETEEIEITDPPDGATRGLVHDVLGTAPIGSTVELWYSANGGPDTATAATVVADPFGRFLFVGDEPAAVGVIEWFVKVGDIVSSRVRVTITDTAEPAAYDPGAHTVAEVQDYVSAHPDELAAVLAAEQGRGDQSRSTLVSWLESQQGAP